MKNQTEHELVCRVEGKQHRYILKTIICENKQECMRAMSAKKDWAH